MSTPAPAAVVTMDPVCVLRWTFRKGSKSITCQLQNNVAGSSYDVCVVPHWDVAATVIEGASTSMDGLRRHAQIARELRAAGWALDRRSH